MLRTTLTAAAVVLLCGLLSPAAGAQNSIQQENELPGVQSWNGPGTSLVEMYASQIGLLPGEPIAVHVSNVPATRSQSLCAVIASHWPAANVAISVSRSTSA